MAPLRTILLTVLAVAMHADVMGSAVHIVIINGEHLAEVVCLPRLTEYLTLKISQSAVSPTRTATMLVLNAGDSILFDYSKSLIE